MKRCFPLFLLALWSSSLLAAPSAFPLKVSENRRCLVDQQGQPFFVMGDTPWFIQKLKLEDARMLGDDRLAKGAIRVSPTYWHPSQCRECGQP